MKEKGVITVSFALIFLLLLAFLLSMLETARIYGLKVRLQLAVSGSLDSLFSMYHAPLFEQYGLLLLDQSFGGEADGEELLLFYLTEHCIYDLLPNTGLLLSASPQYYNMKLTNVKIRKKYTAIEGNGSYFARSVVDYMKYRGASEIAFSLIEYITQYWTGKSAEDALHKGGNAVENEDWNQYLTMEAVSTEAEATIQSSETILEESVETTPEMTEEGSTETAYQTEEETVSEESTQDVNQEIEASLNKSIIAAVKEYMEKSLLSLYGIPETMLSEKTTDRAGSMENTVSYSEKEQELTGGFLENVVANILYNEYVLTYFQNYCRQPSKEQLLQYEIEYLLQGQNSDRENLVRTLSEIFAVRLAMNSLYVLANSQQQEEAKAMAGTVVGWTGIAVLVAAVQLVLLEAVAFTESVLDMRAIVAGKKIDFLKQEADWTATLATCVSLLQSSVPAKESKHGFDYIGYLRILLFLMSDTKKYMRTMDLIEWNMQKQDADFQMKDCIYALEIEVEVEVSPLFSQVIAWLPNHRYRWKEKGARSY